MKNYLNFQKYILCKLCLFSTKLSFEDIPTAFIVGCISILAQMVPFAWQLQENAWRQNHNSSLFENSEIYYRYNKYLDFWQFVWEMPDLAVRYNPSSNMKIY